MQLFQNVSLRPFNTFNLEAKAAYLALIEEPDEVSQAFYFAQDKQLPVLILGGGSNLLFTRDFEGSILKINFQGIRKIDEDNYQVWLEVMAGTEWEDLIDYCVEHHFCGLENLTLIPGKVGSAPIQNIGAYGREVKDVIENVKAFDTKTQHSIIFQRDECHFAYRHSRFKEDKGRYVITSVIFRLEKRFQPLLSYEGLRKYLETRQIPVNLENVRNAVRAIRQEKLPEVGKIGSAGSFFKNPVLSPEEWARLESKAGMVPHFKSEQEIKVPAAWLIEQCGFKGLRRGDAGVWPGQPLVLVNYGNARGEEILTLAREIMTAVENQFGIRLEPEVNII
ncbi:MAG: UDP-N-acetylmuramate dehydrogenase [Bacteroidales bacterium]